MTKKVKFWTAFILGIIAFILLIPVILTSTAKDAVTKSSVEDASRVLSPYFVGFMGFITPLASRITPTTAGWIMITISIIIITPGIVFYNVLLSIPSAILYLIAGVILLLDKQTLNTNNE